METESSDTVDTKAVEAQHRKVEPYSGACKSPCPDPSRLPETDDPWTHRAEWMDCGFCLHFAGKTPRHVLGRCRRHTTHSEFDPEDE